MEYLGYLGALFVGLILGLTGGGGSILTVPILVYAIGLNPVVATAYSLFVVGTTSLFGAVKNARLINFKTAIIFAAPALLSVYLTRRYVIPALPENLFLVGDFIVTKDLAIMVFFAIVMLLASTSMITDRNKEIERDDNASLHYPLILFIGLFLGIVTGLIGAGGGFLIIPVLVLLLNVPMKKAVATSLLIIAINSLIGFTGDMVQLVIDWPFLLTFTAISIVGIFIGIWLSKFVDGGKLKTGFGWFVLVMGFYIILKELL